MDLINKIKKTFGMNYEINYPLSNELKQEALNHGLMMTHISIDSKIYKNAKENKIDIDENIKKSFQGLKEIEKTAIMKYS